MVHSELKQLIQETENIQNIGEDSKKTVRNIVMYYEGETVNFDVILGIVDWDQRAVIMVELIASRFKKDINPTVLKKCQSKVIMKAKEQLEKSRTALTQLKTDVQGVHIVSNTLSLYYSHLANIFKNQIELYEILGIVSSEKDEQDKYVDLAELTKMLKDLSDEIEVFNFIGQNQLQFTLVRYLYT